MKCTCEITAFGKVLNPRCEECGHGVGAAPGEPGRNPDLGRLTGGVRRSKPWIEEPLDRGDRLVDGLECPTEQPAPGDIVKSYKTRLGTVDIISRTYYCVLCSAELPRGLDGNRCSECVKKEKPPERRMTGIMDYITAGSPWEDIPVVETEEKLEKWLEVACQPRGMAAYWKREGWTQNDEDDFTKNGVHMPFRIALEMYREYEKDFGVRVAEKAEAEMIGKLVPGMTIPLGYTEVIRTPFPKNWGTEEQNQRAIGLLRRLMDWMDNGGRCVELDKEIRAFLKEVDDEKG